MIGSMFKDELNRFSIYLDNVEYGFFLIRVNNKMMVNDIVDMIRDKKNPLCVNFAEHSVDYYNKIIDTFYWDCVIFYNIDDYVNPKKLIEGFNINRDNFLQREILYVFILPVYLADYFVIETPNLHSYVSMRINLVNNFEMPFKPILSLDNFVVDKDTIKRDKLLHKKPIDTLNEESTVSDVMEVLDFYKCHKCTRDTIEELCGFIIQLSIKNLNDNTIQKIDEESRVFVKLHIDVISVAFNQRLYDVAKNMAINLLVNFRSLNIDHDISDFSICYRVMRYFIGKDEKPFLKTEVIYLLRVIGSSYYYLEDYNSASSYFSFTNQLISAVSESVAISDDMCLNLSDLSACTYQLCEHNKSEKIRSLFEEAQLIISGNNLQEKTLFVVDFNNLYYKIKFNTLYFGDYNDIKSKAAYYLKVFGEKSSIYASYLTLVAWVLGCVNGDLEQALRLGRSALDLKRDVFTENHPSIAESHYCNSVLLFLLGDLVGSRKCLTKAYHILKNNTSYNEAFIKIIKGFSVNYLNSDTCV